MTRESFIREFKYTRVRMRRLASHDLHPVAGNDADDMFYGFWKHSAKKRMRGFGKNIRSVKRLPFCLCYVPLRLSNTMKLFKKRDSKYSSFYDPGIDRSDPSIAL